MEARTLRMLTNIMKESVTDVDAGKNKEIHSTASTSKRKTKGKRALVVDCRKGRRTEDVDYILKKSLRGVMQ